MNPKAIFHGLVGFVIFVAAWQALTHGNDISDIPTPRLAWNGLVELATAGVLWNNIVASVFRVAWGFCLAAALAIPLGMSMGWRPDVRSIVNPMSQMLRPISPIAWMPFAVVMFGGSTIKFGEYTFADASDISAIFLIFLCSFFPILTATNSAVRSIELKFLRSASNFGVSGIELFRRVILPAALPQILTGLRLALGVAWVVIVAVELLGVTSGLGFQVNDSRNNLRNDYIAAAMFVIGLVGLLLDTAMARLEATTLARRGIGRR